MTDNPAERAAVERHVEKDNPDMDEDEDDAVQALVDAGDAMLAAMDDLGNRWLELQGRVPEKLRPHAQTLALVKSQVEWERAKAAIR